MSMDEGKVDKLSDTLYSRTRYKEPLDERTQVKPDESEAPTVRQEWDSPKLDEMLMAERRKQSDNSFMNKLFIVAVIFFVAAIGIALYMFLGGASFISSKNVDITIQGPVNVSAGEILELDVTVKNKNNADLEVTNLSITYPQGTRNPEDTTQSLTYDREELGKLGAGQEVSRTARAMIFGEKGEVKEIKFSVEYKVTGSNATFYKNKIYEISIGDTPVVMNVSMPDDVSSGEPFTTTIELSANSPEILRNLMVRAEYPYGYSLISSNPDAVTDNNVWEVGDLAPGGKKVIELVGRLIGEDEEERTFRFYTGIEDAGNTHTFKTNLATLSDTVEIARPSLGLTLALNGSDSGDYVAPRAQDISGAIRFKNNLPDKLVNVRAEATLSGGALDELSINAQSGGFYDSQSNKITWESDSSSIPEELAPGDEGRLFFSFASLENLGAGTRNQEMSVEVKVTGISVENRSTVSTSVTRKIKVASQVSLASKVLYSRGPFANTGPIPPKAETPTTYTVVLNVGNTTNDIANSQVTAILGQNVKFVKSSSDELTYNPATNKVTWNMGTLTSGSGFSTEGREASFQISLTPSSSQIGTVPMLVGSIAFTGTDTFTSGTITANSQSLTTRMNFDPTFVQGDEIVAR